MTDRDGADLRLFTSLKAGGAADRLALVASAGDLASLAAECGRDGSELTVLGWGSNVLPSDAGVRGTVAINGAGLIEIEGSTITAESGAGFWDLALAAAKAGLTGLEFAVGIPGTLGGALVSNAGAYRSDVSRLVTSVEVAQEGERGWVNPDWMRFSYRDSRFRDPRSRKAGEAPATMLRAELTLEPGDPKRIYDAMREWQRQRISKQPPPASAGSFFKNVVDPELAQRIEGLTDGMRASGVVPAGFLMEACGLKGRRLGGAAFGRRHANFLLNVGGATATELRSLATLAERLVRERFGVPIEEEVLYIGDWSGFAPLEVG